MHSGKYPRSATELDNLRAAVEEFVLAGQTPPAPIIGPATRVRTQGSCFAENLAAALQARGVAAIHSGFEETINSPIANRVLFQHVLAPDAPYADPIHESLFSRELCAGARDAVPLDDVFIFTLGVAPCLYRVGSTIPVFKLGDAKDISDFELRHTSVEENEAAIRFIIDALRHLNPRIKIVLTVSPVPLNRSLNLGPAVMVDCISKSTLRVVAANIMRNPPPEVYYWPSFEIVRWLAPHAFPAFGADDGLLRHVNRGLVDLIVDLFLKHYAAGITGVA